MTTQVLSKEARRLKVQAMLDARKTMLERNRLGQFATPSALALEIATYVRSRLPKRCPALHFCEPAFGTGSFYSAFLQIFPRHSIASTTGIEIDAAFVSAARDIWDSTGLELIEADFTSLAARNNTLPRPNILLTNPPYTRHHHLNDEQKARLKPDTARLTGIPVSGLAGIYVYYFLLASAWMQDDGIAAWLLPSEFMDVNYGTALKKYLTEQASEVRIHRYNPLDVQFEDALVSSAVVVFRKRPPMHSATIEITYGGTLTEPNRRQRISITELVGAPKWTQYPSDPNKAPILTNENGATLGDLFDIKRGIATGANEFFILSKAEAERRGLPIGYLRPILPSPRQLRQSIIEADSDGYPCLDEPLFLIDCDLEPLKLQKQCQPLWEYLESANKSGIRDRYLVSSRKLWYKQESRAPAPFLCTYMGRENGERKPFRFIWNRSKAIATNLYLMLYPKAGLAQLIHERPELDESIYTALNFLRDDLCAQGRFYGGGLHKIEPKELKRVQAVTFSTLIAQLRVTET